VTTKAFTRINGADALGWILAAKPITQARKKLLQRELSPWHPY